MRHLDSMTFALVEQALDRGANHALVVAGTICAICVFGAAVVAWAVLHG